MDGKIQCTTCRDIHLESEQAQIRSKRFNNATDGCCPKCHGKVHWLILKDPIGRRHKARNHEEWRNSYAGGEA